MTDLAKTETHTEPPLTEPVIVDCLYITGMAIEPDSHCVRFVGWSTMSQLGGEMDERRICVRFAMSIAAARALRRELNGRLSAGH